MKPPSGEAAGYRPMRGGREPAAAKPPSLDYIDFIDAPAVRDHLRRLPPLPPAQQCILIAQSEIRSLTDKLAALREIRAATPPQEFARGCFRGFPKAVRVQRSGDDEPHYRDTVELTLEPEPRFNGGTGDLSPEDVGTIRDLVARNLDAFLAHWDGKMPFDELLTALRGPAAQNTKKKK